MTQNVLEIADALHFISPFGHGFGNGTGDHLIIFHNQDAVQDTAPLSLLVPSFYKPPRFPVTARRWGQTGAVFRFSLLQAFYPER
jgi:hypothetical protein